MRQMKRHCYQTKLEKLVSALFFESITEQRDRFIKIRANDNDYLRKRVFVGQEEGPNEARGSNRGAVLEMRHETKKA